MDAIKAFFGQLGRYFSSLRDVVASGSIILRSAVGVGGFILLLIIVLGFYWSREPDLLPQDNFAASLNNATTLTLTAPASVDTIGSVTTASLLYTASILLEKPGGYLSNDMLPPGLVLDNIPNWEFGVLVQVRDLSTALREAFSRSQSQSIEDKDLIVAEPKFRFDSENWILPSTESVYAEAIEALDNYHTRLVDTSQSQAQFYARADNLRFWLGTVEKKLGSLSQRLSASVGQRRLNTDLAGDAGAEQSTPAPQEFEVKTPWLEIDDVFYEARGTTWALIHYLKAIEHDFDEVLRRKNALVSVQQIIRELEATQEPVMSPIILNGSGFGMFANHSLVMASYISRAHTAIIDLRELLAQG